jgi:quercetin dioxygenase-like cupin family protein
MKKTKLLVVVGLAAALGAGALNAQAPGFKRVELQDRDLSIAGRHAVQARAEFEPGAGIGKHTHPGEELGVVLEGAIVLEVDGQPARTVKAGESFFIPAGVVHAGKNTGKGRAVVLATYVVEKGKPVAMLVIEKDKPITTLAK